MTTQPPKGDDDAPSAQVYHLRPPAITDTESVGPTDLVAVALTDEERWVLNRGLVEWGGPAHCTDELAVAMGFADVDTLLEEGYRIADEIQARRPLSRRDWTRALLATEIVFISGVIGCGSTWVDTTGVDDDRTFLLLRSVQHKLLGTTLRRGAWMPAPEQ